MILQTKRLILRPWKEEDAEDCYRYAKDPRVGPVTGWPPHQSVNESRRVIRDVLSVPETYAIVDKESGTAIGSISLKLKGSTDLTDREDECEIGYWLGAPYWGKGLMTEAAKELIRHAFEDHKGLGRLLRRQRALQTRSGEMWTSLSVDEREGRSAADEGIPQRTRLLSEQRGVGESTQRGMSLFFME